MARLRSVRRWVPASKGLRGMRFFNTTGPVRSGEGGPLLHSAAGRASVVNRVAENPKVGVSLGGGVRKVRFARPGRGKSGGARVVFLFAGEDIPVFLLTAFAKNEKANLSVGERTALIAAAKELVAGCGRSP